MLPSSLCTGTMIASSRSLIGDTHYVTVGGLRVAGEDHGGGWASLGEDRDNRAQWISSRWPSQPRLPSSRARSNSSRRPRSSLPSVSRVGGARHSSVPQL